MSRIVKRSVRSIEESREALLFVENRVRAVVHSDKQFGIVERLSEGAAKRHLLSLLDQLQFCSPLISLGIDLLISSFDVTLPLNFTASVGPCGSACEAWLCGLSLVCEAQAPAVIDYVSSRGDIRKLIRAGEYGT
jgi:hypothetical protein